MGFMTVSSSFRCQAVCTILAMKNIKHTEIWRFWHSAGIILRSHLANFSQFWSKFCHPSDQCKSDEKRFGLYVGGGSGRPFITACPADVRFSQIFARPECSLKAYPEDVSYSYFMSLQPINNCLIFRCLIYIHLKNNAVFDHINIQCHPKTLIWVVVCHMHKLLTR